MTRRLAKTKDRGYGADHERERREWAPLVDAGQVQCRRAGYGCLHADPLIASGEPWDLGHPDDTCPLPKAPEHRDCNRSAGGRNGNAVMRERKMTVARDW